MKLREELERLKPFEARAIIEDLRKGSVPVDYVPFFTVGRGNWLRFIEEDLDKLSKEAHVMIDYMGKIGKPASSL